MIQWIEDTVHPGGGTCFLGNSGGAGEVGFGLAFWNAERLLDRAVMAGGPPMARLDIGCLGDSAEPGWRASCETRWPTVMTECDGRGPFCALTDRSWATGPLGLDVALSPDGLGSPCTGATIDPEYARRESVLGADADLDYPETSVQVLSARGDCTEAPMLGFLYFEAITSDKTLTFVPQAEHVIQGTPEGARAVVDALLGCTGDRPASSAPPASGCRGNLDCPPMCDGARCGCIAGMCAPSESEGACTEDLQCADGNPCSQDMCMRGMCRSRVLPSCTAGMLCDGGVGCDDSDACTLDMCVEGVCQHRTLPEC